MPGTGAESRKPGSGIGQLRLPRRWEIAQAEADEDLLGDDPYRLVEVVAADQAGIDQGVRYQRCEMVAPPLDAGRQAIAPTFVVLSSASLNGASDRDSYRPGFAVPVLKSLRRIRHKYKLIKLGKLVHSWLVYK